MTQQIETAAALLALASIVFGMLFVIVITLADLPKSKRKKRGR